MFFLKAIELNYEDTDANNYITATQLDVSNLSGGNSFSWLRLNQNKNTPMFDDRGDWYEIFPTPVSGDNVTSLIRIFYFLRPTEYTATSDTISYPMSLDYRALGWRVASSYYYSLNKMEEGKMFNDKYEERVNQLIKTLSRGIQSPMVATTIQDNGWSY